MVKPPLIYAPLLVVLIVLHTAVPPATAVWVHECDNVNGNYTRKSTYKKNLDSLLANITTTDIRYGFYNLSIGHAPDVVNLISLCRGDLLVSDCHKCQNYVYTNGRTADSMCPNQKKAVFWSDECMVRYSDDPIFEIMEETPYWSLISGFTIDTARYNKVVRQSLESVVIKASAGSSILKFAINQIDYNSSITIYSAAQCTPDLTNKDCLQCLNDAVNELKSQNSGQRGARYLFPSCNVRYEEYKFYLSSHGAPLLTYPPSLTPSSINGGTKMIRHSKRTIKIIIAASIGSLCVLLVAVACFILIRKRILHLNVLNNNFIVDDDINNESLQFNFNTIRVATENFSDANKLGQGGFGAVYKGRLPDNGQEIAVKRLAGNSSQGEEQFKTEIKLLAKLQHRNLVRLIGFCFHNEERLLIYEFVPNASLDHFLFGANRRAHLNWETRYKILKGIARGILYLHEDSRLRIIHRDLKASNILLDAEMCPKIADFGTARLFDIHQTHSDTRRIVGTYGYMAPEYALHGNFSTKSDVYSFGILLLETICGKRCSTVFSGDISKNLISLIWAKWSQGRPLEVVDSALSDGSESEIIRCIHIGLLCVQDNVVDRPTMSSVVLMMSSESIALPFPSRAAYVITSNMSLNSEDASWSVHKSTDLESITELHVR